MSTADQLHAFAILLPVALLLAFGLVLALGSGRVVSEQGAVSAPMILKTLAKLAGWTVAALAAMVVLHHLVGQRI